MTACSECAGKQYGAQNNYREISKTQILFAS